jgi:hypothetical protein
MGLPVRLATIPGCWCRRAIVTKASAKENRVSKIGGSDSMSVRPPHNALRGLCHQRITIVVSYKRILPATASKGDTDAALCCHGEGNEILCVTGSIGATPCGNTSKDKRRKNL